MDRHPFGDLVGCLVPRDVLRADDEYPGAGLGQGKRVLPHPPIGGDGGVLDEDDDVFVDCILLPRKRFGAFSP